jgi:hypothetical protein
VSAPLSSTAVSDLVRRLDDALRAAHNDGRLRKGLALGDDDYLDIATVAVTELLEDLEALGIVHLVGSYQPSAPRALRTPGEVKQGFLQGFRESVQPEG